MEMDECIMGSWIWKAAMFTTLPPMHGLLNWDEMRGWG
jgi:hypothetical protein